MKTNPAAFIQLSDLAVMDYRLNIGGRGGEGVSLFFKTSPVQADA